MYNTLTDVISGTRDEILCNARLRCVVTIFVRQLEYRQGYGITDRIGPLGVSYKNLER